MSGGIFSNYQEMAAKAGVAPTDQKCQKHNQILYQFKGALQECDLCLREKDSADFAKRQAALRNTAKPETAPMEPEDLIAAIELLFNRRGKLLNHEIRELWAMDLKDVPAPKLAAAFEKMRTVEAYEFSLETLHRILGRRKHHRNAGDGKTDSTGEGGK